jgi:hypothetical protein
MRTWKQNTIFGILAIIVLAFTACSPEPDPTHTHQWGNWSVTKASTCTTEGIETRVCTLDATHIETKVIAIDPTVHVWGELIEGTPPTCTETGSGTKTCTLNSAHTEIGIIPIDPNTHQWGEYTQTTNPTCTEAGIETKICKINATHTETRTGANALGHDWKWIETSTGLETKTCSHFGEIDGIRLSLNIGDNGPGGGKIFYRSETGFTMTDDNSTAHYLEAASVDMETTLAWASSAFISPEWGGSGNFITIDGTELNIGTGRKNTTLILAIDSNAPAAKACNDYSSNGKIDWFLPSRDELNELFKSSNFFDNLAWGYWSSSQITLDGASGQGFSISNGSQGNFLKRNDRPVRAVRAF